MRGYLCDGCGAFDSGESDQRDGNTPPKGWVSVTGASVAMKGGVRHLCGECIAAAMTGTKFNEMKA